MLEGVYTRSQARQQTPPSRRLMIRPACMCKECPWLQSSVRCLVGGMILAGILTSKYSCCMRLQSSTRPGALGICPRGAPEAAKQACNTLAEAWRLWPCCTSGALSNEDAKRQPGHGNRGTTDARTVSKGGAPAPHSAIWSTSAVQQCWRESSGPLNWLINHCTTTRFRGWPLEECTRCPPDQTCQCALFMQQPSR